MGGLVEWVDGWTRGMGGFAKVDNVFWVDGWTSRFVGMGGMGTEMGMGGLVEWVQ